MASQTEIINVALTLLGEGRIINIDQDTKPAREAKAIYASSRNALLAGYNWSFAMKRTQLSALADVPSWGFDLQYQLPPKCLRIVQVGDVFHGLDLTDYRGSQTELYTVEGKVLMTDMEAPLKFRYVDEVTDTTFFSPNFVMAFAAYMASLLAEPLTQSDSKAQKAMSQLQREISLAIRANAIELPPQKLADDEWLMSRL